ncbi:MAG: T9SS type A sorting domain-containing protein [Bacteroidetes bacterium]|nr:T9SS type A sorting domain-containing protein [Bacteroidota bacterium]MCL2303081.1 T9SS type A sorting domain-containing protein [Lentimicrobiaceae bacterium]
MIENEYATNEYANIDIYSGVDFGFKLYPNPNNGTFQIETSFPLTNIGNFKVINLLGATVYETQTLTSNTVRLQTAATGTFFVVIILKDGAVLTRKMVIQR